MTCRSSANFVSAGQKGLGYNLPNLPRKVYFSCLPFFQLFSYLRFKCLESVIQSASIKTLLAGRLTDSRDTKLLSSVSFPRLLDFFQECKGIFSLTQFNRWRGYTLNNKFLLSTMRYFESFSQICNFIKIKVFYARIFAKI